MRPEQWQIFKKAARFHSFDRVPIALLVDSPWMPGYLGVTHLDYYFDPEVWFTVNQRIIEEFPDIIMFPSWWVEYGMAIEPSAMGCRIRFMPDQPPSQIPALLRLEDVDQLPPVDPQTDGLMSAALHRYGTLKERIRQAGYTIPVVAARGPLATAAFVRSLTQLMMDLVDNPGGVHKLLSFTTDVTIAWLKAHADAVGSSVEGVLVLDDVSGLMSRKHYLEFAHPCLKRVFDSVPKGWVKVYHNDANIAPFVEDLVGLGFDVLNWSHELDIVEIQRRTAGKICLMGNIPPLDIATRGTPQEVKRAALELLHKAGEAGIILSVGGGVSPGMPKANLLAMAEAVQEFNAH